MMKSMASTLAALALSSTAFAQAPAAKPPFTLQVLAPGVYAAIDGPEGKSGSNAGFVIGDDGVVVVDSFQTRDAAKALLEEIHKLTPLPVKYVVNTHYHYDHVMGDAVFAEAGATIVAHRNVRGWIRTENLHLLGDRATPAQKTAVGELPQPTLTLTGPLTIWLGARRVELRAQWGHTGGDLTVYVPDAHVLFCGDLLWRQVAPNLIDGTVKDWIATDALFATMPDAAATKYVPGHGDVATVDDVKAFKGYLSDLWVLTKAGQKPKQTRDELVAVVLPRMKAKYGSWKAFDYFAAKEIGFMADELEGKKRTPIPVAD
jgi:cyclase